MSMKYDPGIYRIYNNINKKSYVGGTIRLNRRKIQHFSNLKLNKHPSKELQNDFNYFCMSLGLHAFEFNILERLTNCDEETIVNAEQKWMDIIQPEYNTNKIAGKYIGEYIRTEEAKKKRSITFSEKMLGRKKSNPYKWKSGHHPNLGKPMSEEQKEKLRQANLGEKNPNYGKQRSEETKAKMRVSHDKKLKRLISPNGTYYEFTNVMQFCREQGIENFGSVYALIRGDISSYKGWKTAFVN